MSYYFAFKSRLVAILELSYSDSFPISTYTRYQDANPTYSHESLYLTEYLLSIISTKAYFTFVPLSAEVYLYVMWLSMQKFVIYSYVTYRYALPL